MKKIIVISIISLTALFATEKTASAQFATFDASNLTQAILSFIQDGDNMTLNTMQFLENLGVMEEQLSFLKEMDKRFKEVSSELYKVQEVIRIANNYEMSIRMFSRYVDRLKALDNDRIEYYQVRSLINEGFQYLLFASREVKRAREYLSENAEISEEQRRKGLEECDKSVSRANVVMYNHIVNSLDDIDRSERIAKAITETNDFFSIN